jgi:hypothetical protein
MEFKKTEKTLQGAGLLPSTSKVRTLTQLPTLISMDKETAVIIEAQFFLSIFSSFSV